MNRYDRERFDRDSYNEGAGYNRNDEHYHSARNLTNEFERDYRHGRSDWDNDRAGYRPQRSYHEGDMGDAYERYSSSRGNFMLDSDYERQYDERHRNASGRYDRERNRYSANQDEDYRSRQEMYARNRQQGGNMSQDSIRRGYGISDFEGTSDRFNTLNREDNRRFEQEYDSGSRYRGKRYSSGMGESFPGSQRGVPDTSYGRRSFRDDYSSGMGSYYGESDF